MSSGDSKYFSGKVWSSVMSRATYQLNCFGQEQSTQETLWATRSRTSFQAKRLLNATPLMVRFETSRTLTSSTGKFFCGSQPSRVRLLNTHLTLGLLAQMAMNRKQTRGSSLTLCLCLPLDRERLRRRWRNASAISTRLATGTAPDVGRRTPNQNSWSGREQALAKAFRDAASLRLLLLVTEMKELPVAQLSWPPVSCTFAPLPPERLRLVLEVRSLGIHQAWQATQAVLASTVEGWRGGSR